MIFSHRSKIYFYSTEVDWNSVSEASNIVIALLIPDTGWVLLCLTDREGSLRFTGSKYPCHIIWLDIKLKSR